MIDRLGVAEMNVAICKALGIDPQGISKLSMSLEADRKPHIEVEYSARYIAQLELAGDDDDNPITSRWAYELVPIPDEPEPSDAPGKPMGETNLLREALERDGRVVLGGTPTPWGEEGDFPGKAGLV